MLGLPEPLEQSQIDFQPFSFRRDPVVGSSPVVLRAKRDVQQAGKLRILFVGETGSGKTPFARYSHFLLANGGPRPFEQVNCAYLTAEHFADQLFGHRRGAFTGAIGDRRGLVELARGGELFLDEIGELPLSAQALFLTFLDTMEYYPLGDDRKRRADVRIICATNRNLETMVSEGQFRRDLYSRIAQVKIPVAPLRERVGDIPELTRHFIREFSGFNKPCEDAIVERFQEHPWTEGNVRELRDVVEFLVSRSVADTALRSEHLPTKFRAPSSITIGESFLDNTFWMAPQLGLEAYLEKIEKACLEYCLAHNEGSVESMAKNLKVSRPTLYRRLKHYGLT
jgi:two-component system, NtrC family, response regulator